MNKLIVLILMTSSLTGCLGGWVSKDENVYNNSNATLLMELNKSRKNGTISEEYYQQRKAQILNQNTNKN